MKKSLYGTRDAAVNWSLAYTKVLTKLGFEKGASSPCTFLHPGRNVKLAVHGDDFVCEGREGDLRWPAEELQKAFEVNVEIMGKNKHPCTELTLLNRVIEWREWGGLSWEPDPRHGEIVIKSLGLEGGKPSKTPGVKEHSKRRTTIDKEDGGKADEESIEVMSADKLELIKVNVGDEVFVRDHGRAVVEGFGCCGWRGKIEVEYPDGTRFHCGRNQVVAAVECRECKACGQAHRFGELPEGECDVDPVDEFGQWSPGGINGHRLASKIS